MELWWRPWWYRAIVHVGRALVTLAGLVLLTPLWVLWLLAVVVLRLTRPLLYVPLMLATAGGAALAVWFAATGDWREAGETALTVLAGGFAMLVYTIVAEWIDPDFNRPPPPRRWY